MKKNNGVIGVFEKYTLPPPSVKLGVLFLYFTPSICFMQLYHHIF